MKKTTIVFAILCLHLPCLFAQGFINLNFETAQIIPDPENPNYPRAVFASNAIPGWTSYIADTSQKDIAYNDISLGSAVISIHGTNSVYYPPIQGKYFILLQSASSAFPLGPQTASIGQTGQIPAWAMAISFWGYFGGSLTFNNQPLSYLQTGSTANYNIYTADISALSGQTGELLFTTPFQTQGMIDNIQFSATAVPEPSTLTLVALSASWLGWRFRKKS